MPKCRTKYAQHSELHSDVCILWPIRNRKVAQKARTPPGADGEEVALHSDEAGESVGEAREEGTGRAGTHPPTSPMPVIGGSVGSEKGGRDKDASPRLFSARKDCWLIDRETQAETWLRKALRRISRSPSAPLDDTRWGRGEGRPGHGPSWAGSGVPTRHLGGKEKNTRPVVLVVSCAVPRALIKWFPRVIFVVYKTEDNNGGKQVGGIVWTE